MTDFLEELLNQQEEEEEEFALRQRPHGWMQATESRGDSAEDGASESEEPTTGMVIGPGKSDLERQGSYFKRRADPDFFRNAEWISGIQRGTKLTSNDLRTELNVSAPEANRENLPGQALREKADRAYLAARLWRVKTVRTDRSVSGTVGHTSGQGYGLYKHESIIPGYAALVDAAFARDARRYDGPLRIL